MSSQKKRAVDFRSGLRASAAALAVSLLLASCANLETDRFGLSEASVARDNVAPTLPPKQRKEHERLVAAYGGVYHGRPLMKDVLRDVVARFDEFEVEIRNYLAGGDEVVVHLHLAGVGRESRKPFSMPVMELWRIREGKVVEMRPFLYDAAAMAKALAV